MVEQSFDQAQMSKETPLYELLAKLEIKNLIISGARSPDDKTFFEAVEKNT
jgi:hypothetical protein